MSNQEPTKQTSSTENLPTIGGSAVKDQTVAKLLPESYVARHRALAAEQEKDRQAKAQATAEATTEVRKPNMRRRAVGAIAAAALLSSPVAISALDNAHNGSSTARQEYLSNYLEENEGPMLTVERGQNPTNIAVNLVDSEGQPLDGREVIFAKDLIHSQGKGENNALLETQAVELPVDTQYIAPDPDQYTKPDTGLPGQPQQ